MDGATVANLDPHAIVQQLWGAVPSDSGAHLYAILDSDQDIFPTLQGSQNEYCCLYRGALEQELEKTAPYLVSLEQRDLLTSKKPTRNL